MGRIRLALRRLGDGGCGIDHTVDLLVGAHEWWAERDRSWKRPNDDALGQYRIANCGRFLAFGGRQGVHKAIAAHAGIETIVHQ